MDTEIKGDHMSQLAQEIRKNENKETTYRKNNVTKNPLNKEMKEYLKKKNII